LVHLDHIIYAVGFRTTENYILLYIIILRVQHAIYYMIPSLMAVKPVLRGHIFETKTKWPNKTGDCLIEVTA
jgi:hypothetical protein